ncbi:MAG: hypothetical protein FH756_01530 [Firmicutes bacterium]|nr:hypothetical protein [Bacillota bacterium]
MPVPTITLGDQTYTANKPKAGLWRKLIRFNQQFAKKDLSQDEEAYNEMLELMAGCFNNPDVTPQAIEDGLDLDQLLPKFTEISQWVSTLVQGKAEQFPNGETPAGS